MNRRTLTPRAVSVLYGPVRAYRKQDELFEEVIQALYSAHLRPGDTCVDGGANRGRHTIPMAKLVGHGKVHAYEPIPEVAKRLVEDAAQAHVRACIEVHVCALAETQGMRDFVSFYQASDLYPSGYSGLRKRDMPKEWSWRTLHAAVTTLDASLVRAKNLRFIKLDLEGGEYHALLGAERIITSHRPLIVFENGGYAPSLYQYSMDEVFSLFQRLDYELATILGTPMTREVWERTGAALPWYLIAYPREADWHNWMTSSINGALQRHGFPPMYAMPRLYGRKQSAFDSRGDLNDRLVFPRHTRRWKMLALLSLIARLLSPATNRKRIDRALGRLGVRVPRAIRREG